MVAFTRLPSISTAARGSKTNIRMPDATILTRSEGPPSGFLYF
ncbi:MAG TPA: hypothetical protein VH500_16705 [Nitrososphaeraceae archaeon]